MKALLLMFAAGACAPSPDAPKLDGGHKVDAPAHADATDAHGAIDAPPVLAEGPPGLEVGAYSHTIAIDGVDDFTSAETFATTSSPAYVARVTWDATNLYVGYSGTDVATGGANKWVFAYVDVDPVGATGTPTGATSAPTYRTEAPVFPAGFGAELYARWKCDDSFATIEVYDATGHAWSTSATALAHQRTVSGDTGFVEFAIPRALFGGATAIGVATFMMNEEDQHEATYAGLYAGNFTDGYAAAMPLTKYVGVDFTSMVAPNDPANVKP